MKKFMYLLLALFITGCSGTPGENEIEEQVVASLKNSGLDKIYSVENFEKLNGYEKDDRTYIAIVKYDVIFKIDDNEIEQVFENKSNSEQGLFIYINLRREFGSFSKGDRFEVKKELTFIDTDNGWRLRGGI